MSAEISGLVQDVQRVFDQLFTAIKRVFNPLPDSPSEFDPKSLLVFCSYGDSSMKELRINLLSQMKIG